MANWTKAIVSSMGLNAPSVSKAPSAPLPADMNTYIDALAIKLQKPLPHIETPSDTLDPVVASRFASTLPRLTEQMQNALEWMNTQLEKTHADLDKAMQGGKPEPFVSSLQEQFADPPVCQQYLQCQQEHQEQQQEKQQSQIAAFDAFLQNAPLQSAFQTNQDLVAKSMKIQAQAQSGALLNQLHLPSEPAITYTLPKGSQNLKDMEKTDPAKYNDYKANYSQWFSLKQMFDQVNGNLR